jgi:hypothetical protein
MNIIKSIRVWRNNVEELRLLDCLEFVSVSQDRHRRMDIKSDSRTRQRTVHQ